MIEAIIDGWWKVLALLAGAVIAAWGFVFAIMKLFDGARKSGVDEISAGPVKIDMEDDKNEP
jgi:hypothetical protein